jgi:hypothetical protein
MSVQTGPASRRQRAIGNNLSTLQMKGMDELMERRARKQEMADMMSRHAAHTVLRILPSSPFSIGIVGAKQRQIRCFRKYLDVLNSTWRVTAAERSKA